VEPPVAASAAWRRRLALTVLVALAPAVVEAQPARRPYRIGVLNEAFTANHPTVDGLKIGLRELGFAEGRDVTFDVRFTEGKPDAALPAAQSLVQSGVDLLFTSNETATHAAKAASETIPIVFTLVGDPVASGIVSRLAQPGGNVTGVSGLTTELVAKRLELLKALAPRLRRVWAVYYAADPSSRAAAMRAREVGARFRVTVVPRPVTTSADVERALVEAGPGDGLLPPDVPILDIPALVLETSVASRIPAVFTSALWVEHGALVSYGSDYRAEGVQAARLVAKILRGASPKELPVEGADRIDLALNVKTARLLGLTPPRKVLLRADVLRR
jgi:putative ABC transport system substrate-binding protein